MMPRDQRPEAFVPLPARDTAFTVVEVVIAVVILSIVVSGITLAAAGGSKLRGVSKLQSAMTAAGLKAQEDIVTDRSWMDRPECRSLGSPCDVKSVIRPDSLELDGISTKGLGSTSMQVVSATSQAIDSPVDKLGDLDTDGVVPDFYRIDMQLTVPQSVASRYSSTSAKLTRRLTTTIDRRGKEQEGSLAVEVCRIVNQSDERMAIQGCAETGSSAVKMDGCPPTPRPGCVPAFGWIAGKAQSDTAPSPFVVMHRVPTGISFTVQNTTTGQTWASGSATKDKGLFVFQNLPAGAYKINGLPGSIGGGTERWDSKEVPQFHGSPGQPITGDSSAVVEPGLRNRALVLFRPSRSGTGTISIYADREVHDYRLNGPLAATEMVVPVGTPTSSYQGGGAGETCAYLQAEGALYGALFTCDPLVPGPANCASVYVTGSYYDEVAMGTGAFTMQSGGVGGMSMLFVPAPANDGNFDNKPLNHWLYAKFCTTYSEQHTYTYYSAGAPSGAYYLPGAARGVDYGITPMPDNRVVDIAGATAVMPVSHCTIPAPRKQCSSQLTGMVPGLNTGVVASNQADANANDSIIKMPAWMTAGAMWVHPDGAIDTPAGSVGANPSVHIRGMGECYWTSPRWGGKVEGPCNTCNPVWNGGGSTMFGCSILERSDVVRVVVEHNTTYMVGTSTAYPTLDKTIATDRYPIDFSPPWRCSTAVPSLRAATCSRQPTGGGGVVMNRAGRYTSPLTGGVAIVNSAPISEGAA